MPERATFHVHPERSSPSEVDAILAAGVVAHVGLVDARGPVVIPMIYHYDPGEPSRLYLHGAPHSPIIQAASAGAPFCVTITLLDGLVYSRTALYHSVNYRSVVCFGRGTLVANDQECASVLDRMIGRYYQGRVSGQDYDRCLTRMCKRPGWSPWTSRTCLPRCAAAAPKDRAMRIRSRTVRRVLSSFLGSSSPFRVRLCLS